MAIDTVADRAAVITIFEDWAPLVIPSGGVDTAQERANVVGSWQDFTTSTGGTGGRLNRARRVAAWRARRSL